MLIENAKTVLKAMKVWPCETIGMLSCGDAVVKHGKFLIRGGITNTGVWPTHAWFLDDCFSLDENIQNFLEESE